MPAPIVRPGGADDELRQTLLKYEAILENASIGIAFTRGRCFEHANARFEEMFGWARGTLVGQPGSVVWTCAEQYAEIGSYVGPQLAQGVPVDLECTMARRSGEAFPARLRAKAIDPAQPSAGGTIWIIEDITEQRRAVQALRAAHDELENRVHERTDELAAANDRLMAEIAEREAAERRVRHLAHHDVLTGLPNRRLLQDRLDETLAASIALRCGAAGMFVDLDRFKTINDSLGHAVGDALLQAVSQRLRDTLRPADTVSRVGGDEFVLVLPGITGQGDAAPLAARLLDELSKPYRLGGHDLRVTPSIGIALYPPDGEDAKTLLLRADAAMYHAKAQGRRCFQFFAAGLQQAGTRRFDLENDLHTAVARGELLLHYQPRFELSSGRISATEALVRWQHPQRGMISPGDFIPLAEETGLIHAIGDWVLRAACEQQRGWRERVLPACPVAVNLSAHQFRRQGLPEAIRALMAETGLGPGMLEVEITETALMHDTEQTLDTLRRLVALGVQISVDDFGTGYSSLAYLKRFPVDLLKIDQSFVRDIDSDPDDAAIVQAIAGLARSLGKRVVAEGVESSAQVAFLKSVGCDEGQGYLFSRPLPAAQVEPLLAARGLPRAA